MSQGKSLATACVTDDVVHIDDVAFVLFVKLVESWAAPKESEALSTRTISSNTVCALLPDVLSAIFSTCKD